MRRRRRRLRPGREHDAAAPTAARCRRTTAPATTAGAEEDRHDPGHAGRARPVEPLQRDEDRQLRRRDQGRAHARLRAQPRRQHGVGDRPGDDAGRRHVQGGSQPAARRAVVGSHHAVGHQQRRGHHRRHAHADRPEDRASPGSRSSSTTRTTCTSRPTASTRSTSPRPASGSTSSTRRRWRVVSSLDVPGCDGINHADFTIDGKYVLFTCEFGGSHREDRRRQPHRGRVPAAEPGRHAAGHPQRRPTATPSTSPR